MNWQLVSLQDVLPAPWRNGGGSTRELLAWPTAADWQVRLSVADVAADGPFSRFPGVERWFAVLEGQGVRLRLGAAEHRLSVASDPFRFDGGDGVACSLVGGATRDFNLMAPPGLSQLLRVRGRERFDPAPGTLLGLYAHHAGARITVGEDLLDVPPATLAWCRASEAIQVLVVADEALWLEVSV